MSALITTDELFFARPDAALDRDAAERITRDALDGNDDGELFLEYRETETISLEDGRIRTAGFDTALGFGLRAVLGEETGYAHAGELSEAALKRAASTVSAIRMGRSGTASAAPRTTNSRLYSDASPLAGGDFAGRAGVLAEIDAYARGRDPRVVQVMASVHGEWQAVQIIRADGTRTADLRPLVRLNVNVVVERDGKRESGSHGLGGREGFSRLLSPATWQAATDEALRQAVLKLDSVAAPAGEMEVVLGAGWPGILLHEAIGHGLEGDFNRKKTSAFSGLMGQRVAAPGVTVVEDGILTGYMQDRLNARLMGVPTTGNGRRESYAHVPMPRMTNTVMLGGRDSRADMIASVKKGLYAVNFGGGQVDIVSGKFVFSASEAYLIENGRITSPVKGATLIGNGPDALTKVMGVGDDMELDPGVGTCGKSGQGVPVGVGQPTLKMRGLTVGGTA
jgi:TldD protein